MQGKRSTVRDVAAAIFVFAALAMPFASMLWDGAARMKVHFRTSEMEKPRAFSTERVPSEFALDDSPSGHHQVKTPCSRRPIRFSTSRAPSSERE